MVSHGATGIAPDLRRRKSTGHGHNLCELAVTALVGDEGAQLTEFSGAVLG